MRSADLRGAKAPFALMLAGALLLAACDDGAGRRGRRHRGAAAADRHGRPSAGREAGRVDRVHRPLRGGRSGSRCAPASPATSNSIDFRDGQVVERGQLLFVIDPRPFEVALRARQGRSRQRRGAGRARRHRVPAGRRPRRRARPSRARATTSGCRRRRARRASLTAAQAAMAKARLDLEYTRISAPIGGPHLRPPGRHRQPGDRADAAHHDRLAEPDLLRLRHERGRLPRLPARRARGRAALDPRPLDPGQAQAGRRGRLEPRRAG